MRKRFGLQLGVAGAAGAVAFVLTVLTDSDGGNAVKMGALTIGMVLGIATAVRAAMLSRGRHRAGWVLGAIFCLVMTVVFGITFVSVDKAASAGLALFAVVGVVFQMIQLALLLPKAESIWAKLARLADVAAVTAALGGVAWQFVLLPMSHRMPPQELRGVVTFELLVISGAAWALVSIAGTDPRRHGYGPHLLGLALALEALNGLLSLRSYIYPDTVLVGFASGTSIAAVVLTVLAGVEAWRHHAKWQHGASRPQSYRWLVMPYLPVVLSFLLIVVVVGAVGSGNRLLAWILVITTAMAILRQFLSLVIIAGMASTLDKQANNDSLTGLPNRAAFYQHATEALDDAGSHDLTAVLLIDLDGFKQVNDTLGHAAGDELLVGTGEVLTDVLGERGLAARLGGDEFVVLIPRLRDADGAERVAGILVDRLGELGRSTGLDARVGASIGVAMAAGSGHELAGVLGSADAALYEAKAAGKNTWCRARSGAAPVPEMAH